MYFIGQNRGKYLCSGLLLRSRCINQLMGLNIGLYENMFGLYGRETQL